MHPSGRITNALALRISIWFRPKFNKKLNYRRDSARRHQRQHLTRWAASLSMTLWVYSFSEVDCRIA